MGYMQTDFFRFQNRRTTNPIWIKVKFMNKVKRQHFYHNGLCVATEMGKIVVGASDERFYCIIFCVEFTLMVYLLIGLPSFCCENTAITNAQEFNGVSRPNSPLQ